LIQACSSIWPPAARAASLKSIWAGTADAPLPEGRRRPRWLGYGVTLESWDVETWERVNVYLLGCYPHPVGGTPKRVRLRREGVTSSWVEVSFWLRKWVWRRFFCEGRLFWPV
jgi:hypothetical protein